MLYKFRKKMNLGYFNLRTSDIREKSNVTLDPSADFVVVTLLCDTDINMYLLAINSFCKYIPPREIIVVSDNLSLDNCKLLERCVGGINILPVESFREKGFPVGGCWERLTCILNLLPDTYVVQLDADILTLKKPVEVINAIQQRRSFSLTTRLGFEKMSFINASYLVWERESKHVQNEAEKVFKDCDNAENRRYIRACAGFAGFAKGSFTLDRVKVFSKEIESKIGKRKWSEWGSEQVASNYVIANTAASIILPLEFYPFYEPGISMENVKMFHFIGTHRYKHGLYLRLARKFLSSM